LFSRSDKFDLIRFIIGSLLCFPFGDICGQPRPQRCGVEAYYHSVPIHNPAVVTSPLLEQRASVKLPVVVHILWNLPEENISDEEVQLQLDRLNIDFNTFRTQLLDIPREFKSIVATSGIEFCLARKDPMGNPTAAIFRHQTPLQDIGSLRNNQDQYLVHYTSLGGRDPWDPDKYINIWIGRQSNAYGRSSIGGQVKKKSEDGIVIDPRYFGKKSGSTLAGRTLTHEMGHYLGLSHLWGLSIGDCTEDDGLEDTPKQAGPYYDCPDHPQISCDRKAMFMNFMDFVDDHCMRAFTKDQVIRMNSILLQHRSGLLGSSAACPGPFPDYSLTKVDFRVSKTELTIDLKQQPDEPIFYFICKINGQLLIQNELFSSYNQKINIQSLPPGLYILYIRLSHQHRVLKFFKP
jgi:hypothetical protein